MAEEVFLCLTCDYETPRKSDFKRHVLSNRHKDTLDIDTTNPQQANCFDFVCEHCGKDFEKFNVFCNHLKKCREKQSKPEQQPSSAQAIAELKQLLKEQINATNELRRLVAKQAVQRRIPQKITYRTMMDFFPTGPSLEDHLDCEISPKMMLKYYKMGLVHGASQFLKHYCIDNLDYCERSLWLTAPSRPKAFLIRTSSKWVYDTGFQVTEQLCVPIIRDVMLGGLEKYISKKHLDSDEANELYETIIQEIDELLFETVVRKLFCWATVPTDVFSYCSD